MDAIGLNITDWIILGVVIASGIISLFRGFTKEFLSLFLWVFSFIAAISLEYLVSPFITGYIGNPEISKIGDYVVIFDCAIVQVAAEIDPQVTRVTTSEMVASVTGRIPFISEEVEKNKQANYEQALAYMGLKSGMAIGDIKLDCIFIGSCTNSRIEDLREAAAVVKGKKKAETVEVAMVVPGSGLVKQKAEEEGLDKIFIEAGLEWREPGCSMCLAMNADQLGAGKHCASTSNRNFEGRQGFGGRTHLVSPAMAAAAAIHGRFIDVSVL